MAFEFSDHDNAAPIQTVSQSPPNANRGAEMTVPLRTDP